MRTFTYLLILLCLFSAESFAGTFTSAASGNWTSNTTWGTGAGSVCGTNIPCSGDTVVLADGFTVTATTAVVAGDNTTAITCSGTGTGIFNITAGGSFTYKGNVSVCQKATWTWNAGGATSCQNLTTCTLIHDSSGAGTPSTTNYYILIGTATCASAPCALLKLVGAAGARFNAGIATSSGNTGGFRCNTTTTCSSNAGDGVLQADYANIDSCGTTATALCIDTYPSVSGQETHLNYVKLTNSAKPRVYGQKNNVTASFTHLTTLAHIGGSGSTGFSFFGGTQPSAVATGSVYKCTDCYIDGPLEFKVGGSFGGQDAKVTLNRVFVVGNASTSGVDGPFQTGATSPGFFGTEWDEVILDNVGTNGTPASNPPANLAYRTALLLSSNVTNMHAIGNSVKVSTTFDGGIDERQFNDPTTDNQSDFIQTTNGASSSATVVVKNFIEVPTPNGSGNQCPGTLASYTSASQCDNATANLWCPVISVIQNTYCGNVSSTSIAGVGLESSNGIAGLFAHVNSNIMYKPGTSGAGWIVHWITTQTPPNGTVVDADYNVWWNITPNTVTDRYLNGSGAQYSSPSPAGGNDTNANPGFVDSSRGFLNWGIAFCSSSATTWANVLTELAKMNDDTGSLAMCNINTYFNFVKGGFRPTNGAIATSGESAIRPGAVPLDFAFETAGDHSCGASSNYCAFRPAEMANGGN